MFDVAGSYCSNKDVILFWIASTQLQHGTSHEFAGHFLWRLAVCRFPPSACRVLKSDMQHPVSPLDIASIWMLQNGLFWIPQIKLVEIWFILKMKACFLLLFFSLTWVGSEQVKSSKRLLNLLVDMAIASSLNLVTLNCNLQIATGWKDKIFLQMVYCSKFNVLLSVDMVSPKLEEALIWKGSDCSDQYL